MKTRTLIIFLSALTISILLASVVVVQAIAERQEQLRDKQLEFAVYSYYDNSKFTQADKLDIARYFFLKSAGAIK